MGGKYTQVNKARGDHGKANHATAVDLDALLSKLRDHDAVDVLALLQQPQRWQDVANPLSRLPHQASVNDCPVLIMTPGTEPSSRISNSFRRRLKSKENKLKALPGY